MSEVPFSIIQNLFCGFQSTFRWIFKVEHNPSLEHYSHMSNMFRSANNFNLSTTSNFFNSFLFNVYEFIDGIDVKAFTSILRWQ